MRLDKLVATKFDLSRRRAQEAIRDGRVDVTGRVAEEPGREVSPEASVTLDWNRPARRRVRTRLSVLYEDDRLVVVDKPAGLLTVPTAARERDTLVSRVSRYLELRYRRRPYVGVVHRLDKETSGALLFARDRETLRALQALFKAHAVEREYVTLVHGRMEPDRGTIARDLVRDRGDRRRGVAPRGRTGRRAATHYRVLERLADATLLALRLETGRTHQIRIHVGSVGHPVVGDEVYGDGRRVTGDRRQNGSKLARAPRMMLHARLLGFVHPWTAQTIRCESPLPEDFANALEALRRRSSPAARKTKTPAPSDPGAMARSPSPGRRESG